MSHNLILWGVGTSRTFRAHWMLLELKVEYECRPIRARTGETLTPEFLKLNPRHKIPVLQHGSLVVTESAAILAYLSETFANPRELYVARDAQARARINEWCYFITTELDAGSLYVTRRHEGLAQVYGEAPTAVAAAKEYFLHNLEAMAPKMGVETRYLFGDLLSVADILLVSCIDWAVLSEIALPATVARYRRRVAERPAYQAALKKNFAG